MVWLTAIVLLTFITIGYYVSNVLATQIVSGNMSLFGPIGSEGYNLAKLLEYINIAWGPLLFFLVLLWAIASSAARDVTSEIYG